MCAAPTSLATSSSQAMLEQLDPFFDIEPTLVFHDAGPWYNQPSQFGLEFSLHANSYIYPHNLSVQGLVFISNNQLKSSRQTYIPQWNSTPCNKNPSISTSWAARRGHCTLKPTPPLRQQHQHHQQRQNQHPQNRSGNAAACKRKDLLHPRTPSQHQHQLPPNQSANAAASKRK